MAALLAGDLGKPLLLQNSRGFVAYVRARTRFFDEQVARAAQRGRGQVVIVGAGYDDRALRFRTPGVRFVEADHPVTQTDKRERLQRLGVDIADVAYVAADFETEDLERALTPHLDRGATTTIICESVLPYLTPPAGKSLLTSLSRLSGPNGHLAADLPVIPRTWKGRATLWTWRMLARAMGEPVRTALGPSEIAPLLQARGWHEERLVTGRELGMPASRSEWCFVVAQSGDPR